MRAAALARFLSRFALPLVRGGVVEVGAPLGGRTPALPPPSAARPPALAACLHDLAVARFALLRALVPVAHVPALDGDALALLCAVHDLLALGHPGWSRPGLGARRRERVRGRLLDGALAVAPLEAPASAEAALARYTLVAGLARASRSEHQATYWLGRRSYVGRPVPSRLLVWPRLRQVQVHSTRLRWLGDVGPAPGTERLWQRIRVAAPLLEALHPLDVPGGPDWPRIEALLRFPVLARLVAARALELGLERAGEALVGAFLDEGRAGDAPAAGLDLRRTADGVRFFAYLFWLSRSEPRPAPPGPLLTGVLSRALASAPALLLPPELQGGAPAGARRAQLRRELLLALERLDGGVELGRARAERFARLDGLAACTVAGNPTRPAGTELR